MDHLLVLQLSKQKIENALETMVRGQKRNTHTHTKTSKQKAWFITCSHEVIYIICY